MPRNNRRKPVAQSGARITVSVGEHDHTRVTRVVQEFGLARELRKAAGILATKAEQAAGNEAGFYEQRAYVYGAIALSWASLEGALSELLHGTTLASCGNLTHSARAVLGAVKKEDLRPRAKANTLETFNLVLRLAGKQEIAKGSLPYAAADALRVLRNTIIHPQPGEVVTYEDDTAFDYSSQQDVVKKLKSHLKLKNDAVFPDQVLTPTCASWAVASSEKFWRAFETAFGCQSRAGS